MPLFLCSKEFKLIRHSGSSFSAVNEPSSKSTLDTSSLSNEPAESVGYFCKYSTTGTPFDFHAEEDEGEDVLEVNGVSKLQLISCHFNLNGIIYKADYSHRLFLNIFEIG